jgi:copper(I)-binding protein
VTRLAALLLAFGLLAARAAAGPAIAVSGAWSRPAIGTGVVYLRIANRGPRPDRLDGARSPVARAVELHRSSSGTATMGGMVMNGVMSMRRVRAVTVPAHGTVTFAPGGYHVMLIGLRRDLRPNERFPLRLHFASAGWTTVTVGVRPL